MSKYVAIFVDDESRAYGARQALQALHKESAITVYGYAVISKDANGKLKVQEQAGDGANIGLGALTGSLLGILGGALAAGPVGVAAAGTAVAAGGLVGMATGTMASSFWNLYSVGVGVDFVQKVSSHLTDGKAAVVAEIDENWQAPLDTRMASIGGVVVRTWRLDFEEHQAELAAEQYRKEYLAAKAERDAAVGKAKAEAQKRMDEAKAKLRAAGDRVKKDIEAFEADTKAKIQAINEQIASASAEAKAKLNARLDEIKADSARRSDQLKQAWDLTKQAVS